MTLSSNRRRKFAMCILTGLQLTGVGLFLHPMDPVDFLFLVIRDPLQTVAAQHGIWMACLVWLGLVLILTGLFGLIGPARSRQHRKQATALRQAR